MAISSITSSQASQAQLIQRQQALSQVASRSESENDGDADDGGGRSSPISSSSSSMNSSRLLDMLA